MLRWSGYEKILPPNSPCDHCTCCRPRGHFNSLFRPDGDAGSAAGYAGEPDPDVKFARNDNHAGYACANQCGADLDAAPRSTGKFAPAQHEPTPCNHNAPDKHNVSDDADGSTRVGQPDRIAAAGRLVSADGDAADHAPGGSVHSQAGAEDRNQDAGQNQRQTHVADGNDKRATGANPGRIDRQVEWGHPPGDRQCANAHAISDHDRAASCHGQSDNQPGYPAD